MNNRINRTSLNCHLFDDADHYPFYKEKRARKDNRWKHKYHCILLKINDRTRDYQIVMNTYFIYISQKYENKCIYPIIH